MYADYASASEAAKYFALLELPGVGPVRAERLLQGDTDVDSLVNFLSNENLGEQREGPSLERLIEAVEQEISEQMEMGMNLLHLGDSRYPTNLTHSKYRRRYLFSLGDPEIDVAESVAVIGTSRSSPNGEKEVSKLVEGAASDGYTLVSGLARGIDGSVHRAAMNYGAPTIAVVGTGLGTVFPPEHRGLHDEIAQTYAVYSQFLPSFKGARWSFPERNKTMAGIAKGTVVMQSRPGSGSLLQAKSSLADGRKVFIHVSNQGELENREWVTEFCRRGAVLFSEWSEIAAQLNKYEYEYETAVLPGFEPGGGFDD